MKQPISVFMIAIAIGIASCSSNTKEENKNNGNPDTTMESMSATGPMRDSPQDTVKTDTMNRDSASAQKKKGSEMQKQE